MTEIKVTSEQKIFQEAEAILLKHLGVAKTARFLASWHQGTGDYLSIKDELFAGETVDTLYEKILHNQETEK